MPVNSGNVPGRHRARRQQVRPHRHVGERRERRVAEIALLLDAVGRDRSDLAQHVLPGVVDAGAAAQRPTCRPGPTSHANADARLKLLPLIGNRAVGRKPRIVQEGRERGRLRIDGLRHQLRVPAQAVVDRQAVARLPLVLDEERELLVVDVRRAGRVARDAVGAAALQIEQQRSAGRRRAGRDTPPAP